MSTCESVSREEADFIVQFGASSLPLQLAAVLFAPLLLCLAISLTIYQLFRR